MPNNQQERPPLQVWFLKDEGDYTQLKLTTKKLLGDSELTRYNNIKHLRKRNEYLLSRGLIRYALQQQFNLDLSTLKITEHSSSLPVISPLPDNTFYSISHSKNLLCFVVSNQPIGIDTEINQPNRDFVNASRLFMSDDEIFEMQNVTANKQDYFYRVWCAKEAFYKAQLTVTQSDWLFAKISYLKLQSDEYSWNLHESTIDNNSIAVVTKQQFSNAILTNVQSKDCLSLLNQFI